MGSRPLTKRQIDSATYSGQNSSRDVRWDSTIPGLGIRVYPNGRKAFVLSYRCHGRKRLMTLGTYGVVTLEQARARAREALGQIANNLDPLEKRRLAISGETMADLCAAVVAGTGVEDCEFVGLSVVFQIQKVMLTSYLAHFCGVPALPPT